jgi:hypothetical protein
VGAAGPPASLARGLSSATILRLWRWDTIRQTRRLAAPFSVASKGCLVDLGLSIERLNNGASLERQWAEEGQASRGLLEFRLVYSETGSGHLGEARSGGCASGVAKVPPPAVTSMLALRLLLGIPCRRIPEDPCTFPLESVGPTLPWQSCPQH